MSTLHISKVNQWSKIIQYWLLPGTCVLCHKASGRDDDLCRDCEALLPAIPAPCQTCGLPLASNNYDGHLCGSCIVNPPPFKHIISAFEYAAPVDQLIGAFKYHGKLSCGRVLAHRLLQNIQTFYTDRQVPKLLIPMPLHPKRLQQRGFNQATEIGNYLSSQLDIPLARQLCTRHRNTPPQEGLNAKARSRNLRRAFAFNKSQVNVTDTVAIIDDVVTTTASSRELSSLLRSNSIREVHIWCLARACRKR